MIMSEVARHAGRSTTNLMITRERVNRTRLAADKDVWAAAIGMTAMT
jgi:hypothetical protein